MKKLIPTTACRPHTLIRIGRTGSTKRREVPRPAYEQLLDDLKTMSYCAVGRKYRVSDHAIRKWIRWYGYNREADVRASGDASQDEPPGTIAA